METVFVAGAGPTGLALACALRNAGVAARVVDAAPGPATTSRALGLQPRGVEVLDRLGALADLPQRSVHVNEAIVFVGGRELTRLRLGQQTRLGQYPTLLISQAEIEAALRHRLAELGGEVEWGRAVTAVDQDPDGVVVRFADGSAVRSAWLVGADGAHSAVRKAAGIGFPGVPIVERFFLADVHADLDRPRDATSVWLRGSDMLAAFPLPGGGDDLWRLMTPAPVGTAAADGAAVDEAAVLARVRERVAAEIGGRVHGAEWTSSFQIHRRLADRYRDGRILLAGDAAHIHSPFGGQGLNTGIGDAENLAWKLALVVTGRAGSGLLDTYEAERRPVAADVLGATSRATNLLFGDGALVRFVRDHFAVPLMDRPIVQRMIAERASQLRISDRNGPLAHGRPRLSGPRPGDRVRGVPCRRGQWMVMAPAGNRYVDVVRARLGDRVAELHRDGHDALLVRPDGHLAWRGTDPRGLERWLDAALDRPASARVPAAAGTMQR
jgi:4,5-epoxidase